MKVSNPHWQELGIEPVDITLRNQVGVSFAPENAHAIGETVANMIERSSEWRNAIETVRSEHVFNLGRGAEVAGEYILKTALEKQAAHDAAGESRAVSTLASAAV